MDRFLDMVEKEREQSRIENNRRIENVQALIKGDQKLHHTKCKRTSRKKKLRMDYKKWKITTLDANTTN